MKLRSLLSALCVLALANTVSAQPFAYIANSGTKNVSVIDTATDGAPVATIALPGTNPYAYSVAVSPSGQYVFVGVQGTNQIVVIDAATNTALVNPINLGTDEPGGLAVNAAETRLYVTSRMSNTLIVIDITNIKLGSGPVPEVGRVAVEEASTSNPEGVVLAPNGTKAYVANTGPGTIAEVSLDETNNIYTRTSLTSVGSEPMGLAINSTGTKLYVSDFKGAAKSIDTATKAITSLSVGLGNLSVAITPDNSKIYAPSAVLNKYYIINSGTPDSVSATQPAASDQPWGSAVNPLGTKLYLAMKSSNNVKVYLTSDNSPTATIALPANAAPTSLGDFIGPAMPWTINAQAQTNCTISPAGNVLVANNQGRTFSVTPTSGTCEIYTGTTTCTPLAGGSSQGFGDNYTFSNVTANTTICAVNRSGTYYTLSGDWITSVGGWLVSSPAGINKTSKSADFLSPQSVILSVGDTVNHQVQTGSWTGACNLAPNPVPNNGQTCTLTMDAAKTFGVTIVNKSGGSGPIYNSTKSTYHQTLAEATAAATTGDIIKISTTYTTGGSTTGTGGVLVTFSGGWDATFSTQTKPSPVSIGALTITNVGVIADNLVI